MAFRYQAKIESSASSSGSSSNRAILHIDCSASISCSNFIPVVAVIRLSLSRSTVCCDSCVMSLAINKRLATNTGSHCSGESLLAAIPAMDWACQICDVKHRGPGNDFNSRGLCVNNRREVMW
jgi:hypothetical protein